MLFRCAHTDEKQFGNTEQPGMRLQAIIWFRILLYIKYFSLLQPTRGALYSTMGDCPVQAWYRSCGHTASASELVITCYSIMSGYTSGNKVSFRWCGVRKPWTMVQSYVTTTGLAALLPYKTICPYHHSKTTTRVRFTTISVNSVLILQCREQ